MRAAELINIIYFSLLTTMALFWLLPTRSKIKAVLLGLACLLITGAISMAGDFLRDWLPAPLMAVAYWQSGCFFQQPNSRLQEIFQDSERQILKVLHLEPARLAQTWMGTILELA